MRVMLSTYLLITLLFVSPTALAWGSVGHQVIATLASQQLTIKAQAQVQALLAQEPGSTLASISTWADEHKSRQTAAGHYVNFPRETCVYVKERDCPDGNCLIAAVERQTAVLKSASSDADKLKALKYLVHFVGDLHQPLHAGYADDRGGNSYQVQFFKRGSNLHAVWDSALIKTVSEDPDVWVARLAAKSLKGPVEVLDAVQIAEESCRIVGQPGFYPGRQVHSAYAEEYRPVLEQRLSLGGARLAGILNGVWR
jgi:hypothetical protein